MRSDYEKELLKSKPEYFVNRSRIDCPTYDVVDVHSEQWLRFIKEEDPDIIFSICCNVIFKQELLDIPSLGTCVLHEGITPEYKGLHTPIWALLNRDFDCLGYSIIKANNVIDGGDVLVQGKYDLKEKEGLRTWSWVGHNALIEGIPAMKKAFKELEE
ncbi:MAG: hypothetical protein HRT72_04075, partial [Flavobacteriales bacterium]|nr:hypothetical protein [Flavobacteriales bacterium]